MSNDSETVAGPAGRDPEAPVLVLASTSASRRALLAAAAVPHQAIAPGVDEEATKAAFRGEGCDARALADALAELKALKISRRIPGALVLGCDQTLSLEDGTMFDKAVDRADAARILRQLSGRRHHLHSAMVIAQNGVAVWRHLEPVGMTVRPLSDAFIEAYLDLDWDNCRFCLGNYRIEGPGAQLFTRVEGSQSAVQGLPLLPLLGFLRTREVLAS